MENKKRPSWDNYFMQMANLVRERSTCIRRGVGAVLVKDHCVIATGYNGAPKGLDHCDEVGCLRQRLEIPSGQRHELCRAVHAEQNAIIQAASLGNSIEGATLYVTTQPCAICTKMIINAGIKRIVTSESYYDEFAKSLLKEAGIQVDIIKPEEV